MCIINNKRGISVNNDFVFVDGTVPCYQSRLFQKHNIKHAFFTKLGGVSEGAFESLNFAVGAGEIRDSEENVYKNHCIAAKLFGLEGSDICRSYQTHTNVVELATEQDRGRGVTLPPYDRGVDGMVTKEQSLLLSVRSADCVPVLLCDAEKSVCAAVHAGWRGTVGGITKNAVALMCEQGARKENILAAIGPCIGKCCYEVGREVFEEFVSVSKDYESFFTPKGEKLMLDLTFANRFILKSVGIPEQNISSAELCTYCNSHHFFSHRRNGSVRGTMSALICL